MLKQSCVRFAIVTSLAIGLAGLACDSSETSPEATGTPASKSSSAAKETNLSGGNSGVVPKDPKTLPADAPMKDVLLGRWSADDNKDFMWHFTADGSFVVRSNDKTDLTMFPKEMRNKAKEYFGTWKVAGDEIVLTNISGPSQQLIKEVKISCKRISNQAVEIDGIKYTRNAIGASGGESGDGD